MSANQATVRYARRDDLPFVLDMIQELADYERESDANKATVESLGATLALARDGTDGVGEDTVEPTSPTRVARCLVLTTPEGDKAGIALHFFNYSTWRSCPGIYLEDLYVREKYRGRGYGKRLLVELARRVVAMGGARLEWSVLKWNEPSIRFYESIGATGMHDWVGMRVDGDGLGKLAGLLD